MGPEIFSPYIFIEKYPK